jgi:hypothetical protein
MLNVCNANSSEGGKPCEGMSEIFPFFSRIISFLNSASVATSARGFYFGAVAKKYVKFLFAFGFFFGVLRDRFSRLFLSSFDHEALGRSLDLA